MFFAVFVVKAGCPLYFAFPVKSVPSVAIFFIPAVYSAIRNPNSAIERVQAPPASASLHLYVETGL
jgi:hypothetical protein